MRDTKGHRLLLQRKVAWHLHVRHVEIDLRFGRTLKASMTPPNLDVAVNINSCTRSSLPNACSPTHFGLPSTPW